MVQASATVAYVAAAANRFPYTAGISPESLVAFGSHKIVSLWNLSDGKLHATLPGHEGVFTCVRFMGEAASFQAMKRASSAAGRSLDLR